jgi:hypothetical protein
VCGEQRAIVGAGVLAATVGEVQQSGLGASAPQSHDQRILDQFIPFIKLFGTPVELNNI